MRPQPSLDPSNPSTYDNIYLSAEEEDDLEFTVSFPSPSPSLSLIFEEAEPVVFILGWEGAGAEELGGYARMYEVRVVTLYIVVTCHVMGAYLVLQKVPSSVLIVS